MGERNKMKKDKRITKAMIQLADVGYGYYTNYPRHTDFFKRPTLNCSDEVCPGSRERGYKIRKLLEPTPYTDFMETYSKIISEFHDLVIEEIMTLMGWSESKANQWFNHYVDVNHVEINYSDEIGDYLIFQPILLEENKYG